MQNYQVTFIVLVEADDDDDAEQLAKESIRHGRFEADSVEEF
jgi:hypothetical protein